MSSSHVCSYIQRGDASSSPPFSPMPLVVRYRCTRCCLSRVTLLLSLFSSDPNAQIAHCCFHPPHPTPFFPCNTSLPGTGKNQPKCVDSTTQINTSESSPQAQFQSWLRQSRRYRGQIVTRQGGGVGAGGAMVSKARNVNVLSCTSVMFLQYQVCVQAMPVTGFCSGFEVVRGADAFLALVG